jgi:hypothetical protein
MLPVKLLKLCANKPGRLSASGATILIFAIVLESLVLKVFFVDEVWVLSPCGYGDCACFEAVLL